MNIRRLVRPLRFDLGHLLAFITLVCAIVWLYADSLEPELAYVRGKITTGRHRLPHATITLVSTNTNNPRRFSKRASDVGSFEFPEGMPCGVYRVEISLRKTIGGVTVETIPARYNTQTEYLEELHAGWNNVYLPIN